MGKCPKCKAEIEHLGFSAKVEHFGTYQKDYVNGEDWDTKNYGDWEDIKFCCPNCEEVIAETQEDADKLFN